MGIALANLARFRAIFPPQVASVLVALTSASVLVGADASQDCAPFCPDV